MGVSLWPHHISSVQFSSVAQSCLTLCNPMNRSTPGLPVHHQLPESIQTHVLWVGDAIQPSHPLSSPSPPALNLSQHQGVFKWVSSLHQEFQLQHQSFQWTPRIDFLQDGLVGSPCSPRDSQESSLTPQFKSIHFSALSFLYSPTFTSIHISSSSYLFLVVLGLHCCTRNFSSCVSWSYVYLWCTGFWLQWVAFLVAERRL